MSIDPSRDAQRQPSFYSSRSLDGESRWSMHGRTLRRCVATVSLLLCSASIAAGQVAPSRSQTLEEKGYRHPEIRISGRVVAVDRVGGSQNERAVDRLQSLGVARESGFLDPASDRWSTLLLSQPLVPGSGKDNTLQQRPQSIGPTGSEAVGREVWLALRQYLRTNEDALQIDLAEIQDPPSIAVHDEGRRIQIHAGRAIDGVTVRDSSMTAVVNHGNLILLGFQVWGDVAISTRPEIDIEQARVVVGRHLDPFTIAAERKEPELIILATRTGAGGSAALQTRYEHRLAWVLRPEIPDTSGSWEALVDAHSGELLEFRDRNSYASTRKVVGGVFPFSNDGTPPDGVEQPGYPMPYTDITSSSGTQFTDGGGNHPVCVDGDVTTSLNGQYIRIDDFCGPTSETSSTDIDLGAGAGADCDVPNPGTSSTGNTHAARTAFYELNRIGEQARAHLPGNLWLQQQLTAVVNIPDFGIREFNCNAFWDEITVNFFTSGTAAPSLTCSNTGELAAVLDHEWGHGLDNNDVNPSISSPGEGIADIYAALRLNDSCIGRGFYQAQNNCGDDDPCLDCDGVRDIDWRQRTSQSPHDLAWIDNSCQPPLLGDIGPCGGAIHCEGAVYSEAVWDLVHWDLQTAPYNMDLNTALEVGTRLTYLGSGLVGSWYNCVDGTGTGDGCNADSGYMNLLAIDDDNGDLVDGTPHMEAIFAAFDRHGIACSAPVVQTGGCSSTPTEAPNVVATPVDRGVELTWDAIAGASGYEIFRTDGEFGCNLGKIKVGETTTTDFFDHGLLNGREYYYIVVPKGADASCFGPASSCTSITPVGGANLGVDPASVDLTFTNGDLDAFLDNCETAELSFDVFNTGTGQLHNVSVVGFEVLSHPGLFTLSTSVPLNLAGSMTACESAPATIAFQANGLSFNDTVVIRVDLTSDELAGRIQSHTIRLLGAETSVERSEAETFDFESDLDGWQIAAGTFDRLSAGGGANGSTHYLASSSSLPDQCDVVRSPILRLTPTSTLALSTQYDIETFLDIEGDVFWFDRANVAIYDVDSGKRTMVEPDGGRAYNASGLYGSCGTQNQPGWADTESSWAESTWSSFALDASSHAGEFVQIDISYGTDAFEHGSGFLFDEVTVTDVDLIVSDGQGDSCEPANQAPVADDDSISPSAAAPTEIDVLDNDFDPDVSDSLRIIGVTQPAMGQVTINSIGPGLDTVTYTPDGGVGRVDVFQYSVSDGRGGSDFAQVTVDLDLIFYDGFEEGSPQLWEVSAGICDPDGAWTLNGPPVQFTCCLGLVDIDISAFDFSADGATITSSPSNPVPLQGSAATCPVGSFSNSGILAGGCNEIYTLDGSFTGADSWSGTYTMDFVGPDCDLCAALDPLNPCVEQIIPISATRP